MRFCKLAVVGLVLAVGSVLMASSAQAAPTRVPTSFNAQKHVYQTGTKLNDKDLEQKLSREALSGQSLYVVFTVQGDEAFTNDLASDMAAKLLQTWQVQQGFPADNYVIVVVVQNKLHPQTWQPAVIVGRKFSRLGLTGGDIASAVNKNKASLTTDPTTFAVATVHDINDRINALTSGSGNGNGGGNHGGSNGGGLSGTTWLLIGGGIVGVIVLVVVIFVIVRKKQKEAARKKAEEKLAGIETLKGDVEQAKGPLTVCGLTFAPFQSRLDGALELASQARANLENDPEKAEKLVTDCESRLQSLIRDLKRAVELKNDTVLDGEITAANQSVTDTRGREVVWNFPGVSSQPKQTFLLNEQGCNPDQFLANARTERAAIVTALTAGDVAKADQHWTAGRRACTGVAECISRTMSAKERVEREIATVLRETEASDKHLVDGVKRAYLAQQFISSQTQLSSLERLIADRREARRVVASCAAEKQSVQEELRTNDRYVTLDTNNKFTRLVGELNALQTDVTNPASDWSALRGRAEGVQSGFRQVRQDIADGRSAFDAAQEALRNLNRDFTDARFPDPRFSSMTDASRENLQRLLGELDRLTHEAGGSKKDWKALKTQIGEAGTSVKSLRDMIREDNTQWEKVDGHERQLSKHVDVRHYTRTVGDRSYNGGEALAAHDPDFRAARDNAKRHLQMARHYWTKREWTGLEQELTYLVREYSTLNLIGWWSVGQMTRDSDDLVAQHYAFSAVGFRDNVTWSKWRDKFVSKQAAGHNGVWEPVSYDEWKRGGAGGGDLTRSPDFNGYGGDDPWTAPVPVTPPANDPANPGTGDM